MKWLASLLLFMLLAVGCASSDRVYGDPSGLIELQLGAIRLTGFAAGPSPLDAQMPLPRPASIDVTISNSSHDPITVEAVTLMSRSGLVSFPPMTERTRRTIEPGSDERLTIGLQATPTSQLSDARQRPRATVRAILKLQSGKEYTWDYEVPVD